ncbi:MAG: amylo-alpha-1,6-glucosidase [Nitrobacter sp. 62-13]|uniref:amylo-alpha-1,6-glucosidase n=1 Tax=Nitrobacter sp. 62-13 TaxID=1895797 RepID=UPI00095C15B3|nr:glycogen debranching N-terminal domain-containing protein [Nitrobacter sp. 62-13]OJU25014.1 MAG: amylo-alpha-1,6-glucosidase [Nitrobacter sp. 62-13]
MTLEITVGPPQIAINQGHSVLITERDGQIPCPSKLGLYFFDTRLISNWMIYANGMSWQLLNSGNLFHYASRIFLTNPAIATEQGSIPPHTLQLTVSRSIDGGLHEDIDLVNHGMVPVRFELEIMVRSDFADLFDVKSASVVRRGRITTQWCDDAPSLRTVYRNKDFCRELSVAVRQNDSTPVYANGRISFEVDLQPAQAWHTCLLFELGDGKVRAKAPDECIADVKRSRVGQGLENWQDSVLKIETSNEGFRRLFRQAVEDMASLRLPIEGDHGLDFVPAAGVPWFVALFGRDSLIVSLQNALVYPSFARGTLDILGARQATKCDDFRDAEPGKIPHELRFGELAHFNVVPHAPYYGTADATVLYLIVLHSAWRSTGDRTLLDRHLPTAQRCLDWIDQYGDRDGDGFQEYQTRSSAGYENQGWKDAGDAVLNVDGSKVKGPKALCEIQGYVYDAWQRMAEIFDELGEKDAAGKLRVKARTLFDRFNEAFWDESSGFYAFALDGDKRKVLSIASNPGHCLWSGIVSPDRADRVVRRLMAADMWSGWGIRTLSADHPAYNPFSYQNGSVWPHDNSLIALGFRRYGFAAEAIRIAHAVSNAGSYFMQHQMPELYAGLGRNAMSFPVQYLGANVPQAWAAGSAFFFLQAILGLQPNAPENKLYVDPVLPDWLPDITIKDLQLGQEKFDIQFRRDGLATRWEVLKGDAGAVVNSSFATGRHLHCNR